MLQSNDFKKNIITTSLISALALTAPQALASIMLTASTEVTPAGELTDSDMDTDPASVSATTGASGPLGGGFAHSSGDDIGGAVDFRALAEGLGNFSSESMFVYSDTILNSSGVAQNYFFDFFVPGGGLSILGSKVFPHELGLGTSTATVGYSIEVILNGTDTLFSSDLSITATNGPVPDVTLSSIGTDEIGGTLLSSSITTSVGLFDIDPDPGVEELVPLSFFDVFFDIAEFDKELDLGTWADGESFTIDYTLTTHATASGPINPVAFPACEFGGEGFGFVEGCLFSQARIGDPASPFSIPASFGPNSLSITSNPTGIPEPATLAMFGVALAGLGAARRLTGQSTAKQAKDKG